MSLSRAPRLAGGQVPLRVALLLLGLWAVLAPVQGSPGRPSWRYISTELVIPRKEAHRGKGVRMPGWLSYSLRFGGQRHVIHMRPKRVFWPGHLLMTQDDQGALQVDYPFIPSDCYYLGYLEEIPFSMVTLDTCYGGLQGIMKLDDLTYEIRPLKDSQRFEHIVSQIVADGNATGPTSTVGYEGEGNPVFPRANASEAPRIASRQYPIHQGVIKGFLHCSYSMYLFFRNMTETTKYLLQMGSIIDSLYKTIAFRFYISLLVVFNQRDPANVDNYSVPYGPYYQYYHRTFNIPHRPHTGLLLNKFGPHEKDYSPTIYTVCRDHNLIFIGHRGRHVLLLSIVAAQQIGRSIGFYYDESSCVCQRRTTCIMNKLPLLTDSFSNCTFLHLHNIITNFMGGCMFSSHIVYLNKSLTHARCGNREVDHGEQCDCGSFKECYSNPCCDDSCKLTSGSVCDTGRCCTNCTFSSPGTLCRPIQNICDLPEYCLGASLGCPENVYLQDGTPCTEEGYCYHGNCTDRSVHCKEIFGKSAMNAVDACYTINKKANRYGHCRKEETVLQFQACADSDIKCGRLQCTNVSHLPRLQEHVGFHQSVISGSMCFGVDLHRSTGTLDVGHVRSGTPCAPGKYCLNTYCNGTLTALRYDCSPDKCSHRGMCNNRRNCHCHVGWDPPLCKSSGAGGSVDSGPPPRKTQARKQREDMVVFLRYIFGRVYAFIAAVLLGVAMNVKTLTTTTVKEVTVGPKKPKAAS